MTAASARSASRLVCSGCGASPALDDPYPFRCPNHDTGDVDHVLARVLDVDQVAFPTDVDKGGNPFVTYRELLHSYHRGRAAGRSDRDFVELVERLDAAVATVDGHGFVPTPLSRSAVLSDALGFAGGGGVWVKDETGNVAGSHKARHLMGVALHLEVAERIGLADPQNRATLAVASCGNAALAAAVLARADGRLLRVFVPVDADPRVTRRLRELGADVVDCERRAGDVGDPCYLRLLDELSRGALPFTCQGNLNGLAIEGGETLGYELVSAVRAGGWNPDHLVVQVGGGALASSCVQALQEARAFGALPESPKVHTVQTTGAHPLERAYSKVRELLDDGSVEGALRTAARRRSAYMRPWGDEPKSIATGIVDDETYDWLAVVGGMLSTGGVPVVVSEERLTQAHVLGTAAGFPVEPTGTAGLAGLMDLVAQGVVAREDRVVVLFTGVQR